MKLTFYGQSAFLIELQNVKILFDPFIKNNPLSKNIKIGDIKADYLFLSHGHGDHAADAIELAKQTGATCVGAAEVATWFTKNGIEKVHPLNQGGPVKFPFGTVRGVNAIHSSSFPDGSYAGNPLGFVFTTNEGNFYFAGDTALTMDMQLIPRWAKIDFAIMPIGGNYTMDYNDALIAADFVKTDVVVGVHYNTFDLIKIDTDAALEAFKNDNKVLLLPKPGETIEL